MKKIKIAQIGTSQNSHGNNIWNSIKKQSDRFEVMGYALPEHEREKFPARMPDFQGCRELAVDEILSNPEIEAVTVETEELYLTKYALLAARHGKHIHMEKPGGTVYSEYKALIDEAKRNRVVFHTGYMYRYNPYIQELMQQIKAGELGEIISVEAQMNCMHPNTVRQWLSAFPGGIMFFLGCHLIDLILQIQGKPETIIPINTCTGIDGVTAQDFGMAVFEYKHGKSFAKVNAAEYGGFARRQLVVAGMKKTVEIKPLEFYDSDGIFSGRTEYASADWNDAGITERSHTFDRYDAMMRCFGEYVRGEKENPWSYEYELELYETVLKACGGGTYV